MSNSTNEALDRATALLRELLADVAPGPQQALVDTTQDAARAALAARVLAAEQDVVTLKAAIAAGNTGGTGGGGTTTPAPTDPTPTPDPTPAAARLAEGQSLSLRQGGTAGDRVGQLVVSGTATAINIIAGPPAGLLRIDTSGAVYQLQPIPEGLASFHLVADVVSAQGTVRSTVPASVVGIDVIGTMIFEGQGFASPAGTITKNGTAFLEGDLRPGDTIALRNKATGEVIRTAWAPGAPHGDPSSFRTAAVFTEAPAMTPTGSVAYDVVRGITHPSPGPDLDFATLLAAHTIRMETTPDAASGQAAWTWDPAAALLAAPDIYRNPLSVARRGYIEVPATAVSNAPQVFGNLPSGPLGITSLRADFIAYLHKDGSIQFEAAWKNDLTGDAGGGAYLAALRTRINGTLVQNVARDYWTAPDRTSTRTNAAGQQEPDPNKRHEGRRALQYDWLASMLNSFKGASAFPRPHLVLNTRAYYDSGVLPNFDTSIELDASHASSAASLAAAYAIGKVSDPYHNYNLSRDGGGTGGREEIGYVTKQVNNLVRNGTRDAVQACFAQAAALMTRGTAHWDRHTKRPVNVETSPRFVTGRQEHQHTTAAGTDLAIANGLPADQRRGDATIGNKHDIRFQITMDHAHDANAFAIPAIHEWSYMLFDAVHSKSLNTVLDADQRANGTTFNLGGPNWKSSPPDLATGDSWAAKYAAPQTRGNAWDKRADVMAIVSLPVGYPGQEMVVRNYMAKINGYGADRNFAELTSRFGDLGLPVIHTQLTHFSNYMGFFNIFADHHGLKAKIGGPNMYRVARGTSTWAAIGGSVFEEDVWRTFLGRGFDVYVGTDFNTATFKTFGELQASIRSRAIQYNNPLLDATWDTKGEGGDYTRNALASLSLVRGQKLHDLRYRVAASDGFTRIWNERPGIGGDPAPKVTPDRFTGYQANANGQCAEGMSYRRDSAPVYQQKPTVVLPPDAAEGTVVDLWEFGGCQPRGSAGNIYNGVVITSQPAGNPFTLTKGFGLLLVGPAPTGLFSVSGYARTFDAAEQEYRSLPFTQTYDGSGLPNLEEVPVTVSTISKIYQYVTTNGASSAPVKATVTPAGSYSNLEARVVNFTTQAPLTNWVSYGGGTATAREITVTVPASGDLLGIAVRINGKAAVYAPQSFQVGDVIAIWGQSQAAYKMGAATTAAGVVASAPFYHCLGYGNESPNPDPAWRMWSGDAGPFDGGYLVETHNRVRSVTGWAVGFTGYAYGAGKIAMFDNPDTDPSAIKLKAALDQVPNFRCLDGFIGGTDAVDGTTPEAYSAGMTAIHAWLRARYPHDWAHFIQPQWHRTGGTDAQVAGIRKAQLDLIGTLSGARYPYTGTDIALRDGIHQTDAGQIRPAQRFALAFLHYIGKRATGASGPTLVSAARVSGTSAVVRLTFAHNGGTGLVNANGTALPQNLRISAMGSTTALSVASFAITGPTTAEATLSAVPAAATRLDTNVGYGVGIMTLGLYDNQVVPGDNVGLPIRHTANPVTTAELATGTTPDPEPETPPTVPPTSGTATKFVFQGALSRAVRPGQPLYRPLFTARKLGTTDTMDFYADGATGLFATSTLTAWAGATAVELIKFWDHGGNDNHFDEPGPNGFPRMTKADGTPWLTGTNNVQAASAEGGYAMQKRGVRLLGDASTDGFGIFMAAARTNSAVDSGGDVMAGYSLGTDNAIAINPAAALLAINGTRVRRNNVNLDLSFSVPLNTAKFFGCYSSKVANAGRIAFQGAVNTDANTFDTMLPLASGGKLRLGFNADGSTVNAFKGVFTELFVTSNLSPLIDEATALRSAMHTRVGLT